jgi:hypothetical protein
MLRPETGYRFRNWDETLECRPKHLYRPESEEEILEIVREASDAGETVRTFGAGHSWSPLVVTDDTLINLDKLDRIVSVDGENQRVAVQAGIRLKELNQVLPKHNLGMKNLGSIGEQSIAGAISTATHRVPPSAKQNLCRTVGLWLRGDYPSCLSRLYCPRLVGISQRFMNSLPRTRADTILIFASFARR